MSEPKLILAMKKHFYPLLLLALPFLFLASCNDDNDLPDVDINVSFNGLYEADGEVYALRDTPFEITSVTATPAGDSKEAALGSVRYYIDGAFQGTSVLSPYEATFDVADLPDGPNVLGLQMGVFQVDKSVAWANLEFKFKVVDSQDDLPDGAVAYTNTTAQAPQKK